MVVGALVQIRVRVQVFGPVQHALLVRISFFANMRMIIGN